MHSRPRARAARVAEAKVSAAPAPLRVVLATRSVGKRDELRALFSDAGIIVESLNDAGVTVDAAEDALEVHDSFEANARAKARWFAARLPGRAIIADDSGLVVDALGGAPGVRSKRWAGSAESGAALESSNNAALLRALASTIDADARSARYVSVVVCVREDDEWIARGDCDGRIVGELRGDGGFGYDPLFFSADLHKTFGQATREEKSAVSHRGRAMRALLAQWSPSKVRVTR